MRVTTAIAAIGTGAATEVRIAGGWEERVGVTVTDTWGETGCVDLGCVEATEECGKRAGELVVHVDEGGCSTMAEALNEEVRGSTACGLVGGAQAFCVCGVTGAEREVGSVAAVTVCWGYCRVGVREFVTAGVDAMWDIAKTAGDITNADVVDSIEGHGVGFLGIGYGDQGAGT